MKNFIFYGSAVLSLFSCNLCIDAKESFVDYNKTVVHVDKGVFEPAPFAMYPVFDIKDSYGEELSIIVKNDLNGCGLFRAVSEQTFMQKLESIATVPNYMNWKTIGSHYLVVSSISYPDENHISIRFKLYDVISCYKVCEYVVNGSTRNFRKMAHMVSNYIYKALTGEDGYFDSKVTYVSLTKRSNGRKIHRLAIMDYDGYNHRFLTDGSSIVLTPRFTPNGDAIVFFSYGEKVVRGRRLALPGNIYKYDLKTNKISKFFDKNVNMNYAPVISPDGKKMVYSMSQFGESSLYELDLETRRVTRLTNGRCIDTSPSYSPDMRYIAFNSDRCGSQQLYILDTVTKQIKRLSPCGKGQYATPVWSPNGRWIAFTRFGHGKFYIGVIRSDGSGEKLLARGYLVEGPTWSSNGRVLMFSHQDYSGREKLYSVDSTGFIKREIVIPNEGIDPNWLGSKM